MFETQLPIFSGVDGGARLTALILSMYGYPTPMDATLGSLPKAFSVAYRAALEIKKGEGKEGEGKTHEHPGRGRKERGVKKPGEEPARDDSKRKTPPEEI